MDFFLGALFGIFVVVPTISLIVVWGVTLRHDYLAHKSWRPTLQVGHGHPTCWHPKPWWMPHWYFNWTGGTAITLRCHNFDPESESRATITKGS